MSRTACCPPAGAIVGGQKANQVQPPTGAPDYQVALIRNDRPGAAAGQFCGGTVRNEMGGYKHIVTAAHCVFDNSATAPGQPISPSNLDVIVIGFFLVSPSQLLVAQLGGALLARVLVRKTRVGTIAYRLAALALGVLDSLIAFAR